MDDLVTIIVGSIVGGILGAVGYVIDQTVTADGATFYLDLFWAPGVWGGLLITVIMLVMWMAGVIGGIWALATFVGWMSALIGAWLASAVLTWMGIL